MPVNPTSDISIVSAAFVRIGHRPISSFSDSKTESLIAKELYEQIRRDSLAQFHWGFALRRQPIAEITSPADDLTDRYSAAYQVPNSALKVLGVGTRADYELMAGGELWTNDSSPKLWYIEDTVTGRFPPWFVTALTIECAAAFSLAITKNMGIHDRMARKAMDAWVDARQSDATQRPPLALEYQDIFLREPDVRF